MFHQYQRLTTRIGIVCALLLITMPTYAVEVFKVSRFNGANQIWFEAEAFDERDPEGPQFFPIAGEEAGAPNPPKGDTFGTTVTRAAGAGGRITYTFDISKTDGGKGTWYLWARLINPGNQSDYLLVEGDDRDIPDAPPYPGGDAVPPFDNNDDRIFEFTVAAWLWDGGAREGHTKELQEGLNTMHIFHRQGNNTRFIDVFMWTDSRDYRPTDEDYKDAKEMEAGDQAVDATGKLTTTWGRMKSVHKK